MWVIRRLCTRIICEQKYCSTVDSLFLPVGEMNLFSYHGNMWDAFPGSRRQEGTLIVRVQQRSDEEIAMFGAAVEPMRSTDRARHRCKGNSEEHFRARGPRT